MSQSEGASPEWIVVSSVSSVEAHITRLLSELIESEIAKMSKLSVALLSERRDDIFRTWDSRLEWLSKGFGVKVAGDREIQDCKYVADLRNAILHGGSELTPMQIRSFGGAVQLKRRLTRLLGVQFDGTGIKMDGRAGDLALGICRRAVYHIDREIVLSGLM